MKGVEIIEFTPYPKNGERCPIEPAEGSGGSDTDEDPLISGPVTPMTIPIEFYILGM